MDLQRNILIVALLVVSYLLFISWQNDYAGNIPVQAQAAAQQAAAQTPGNDTPTAAPASTADLDGLAPASSQSAGAIADAPVMEKTDSRVVKVHTDVYEIDINLNGGDITGMKLLQYPASRESPDTPVRLLSSDGQLLYVAQSGLVATTGPDLPNGERGNYRSDAAEFRMVDGNQTLDVILRLPPVDGVTIEKVYRFNRGDYSIDIRYRVRNEGAVPWSGFLFGQLKRDGSGDPANPGGGSYLTTSPSGLGPAFSTSEEVYRKISFKDVLENPVKHAMTGGWIGFIQHYFVSAWVPSQDIESNYFVRKSSDGNFLLGFTSPQVTVAPGTQQEFGSTLYAGPKLQDRLAELSKGLDLTADYGPLWFISQPLLWLLVHIEALVGNWGVAIILLTLCVKILFFYPSHISYRSMANMRRITPELTRLREEHKNDRQKQAQAMMDLYRKEKINPLGGCLPILVQMPVFIALYWVLLESVELRQAPFMLWITDLSVKDPYFVDRKSVV